MQTPKVVNVGRSADPLARRIVNWIGLREVPMPLPPRSLERAVFNHVCACLFRVTPCFQRGFAVVWMNGIQPPEADALVQLKSGKLNPLRTTPGAITVRKCLEYQLRN